MADPLCLLRGGGDLATGVACRLFRAGWPVIVLELAQPMAVRRDVALASAVVDGVVDIEGMVGRRVEGTDVALAVAEAGEVAVLVSPSIPAVEADVIIDARLAKVNIDTLITDAELVIGLGPGFTAGVDCHAVVETQRGHQLGRVLWEGGAAPNTGVPGEIGGQGAERVLRAPADGTATWNRHIGDTTESGEVIGSVGGTQVAAPFAGIIRGLIAPDTPVIKGTKIGDVDPRLDFAARGLISDKALAIGGGVVEAILTRRASR
ncbi:MAG: EF2563 family selenium-dependent molybdenum hydroxylase system protein [Actinomycetia bacterium]|nr:EF2563 family selenium-dependent molybdenum hydroxylase system protein [Actinomycetes bacterium]